MEGLTQSAINLWLGERFSFQQDNDLKYAAKAKQKLFKKNKGNSAIAASKSSLQFNRKVVGGS